MPTTPQSYYTPDYPGGLGDYASPIGGREEFLDELFRAMFGAGPVPGGMTPQFKNFKQILRAKPAMSDELIRSQKKYAKQQFRRDQANITEGFGKMGARFGTDLADTLGRNAQDFREGLYAQELAMRQSLAENAKNRSLQALNTFMGTGQFTTGLEFTRGESAAGRRMEEILQELRNAGALDVAELQAESALDIELLRLLGLE